MDNFIPETCLVKAQNPPFECINLKYQSRSHTQTHHSTELILNVSGLQSIWESVKSLIFLATRREPFASTSRPGWEPTHCSCHPNTCPHSRIRQPLCDPHNCRSEFGHSDCGHDGKPKIGKSLGVYES